MRSQLVTLTDAPEGFGNVLIAYGPGSGIMRPRIVLRDTDSIDLYGEREIIREFPMAVDLADLTDQAQEFLDEISDPARFQRFTIQVVGDAPKFRLGQKLRVSDSVLGISTVAELQEIDSDLNSVTLRLGNPPANLIDMINDEEDERNELSLGLPAPTGLRARGGLASIELFLNPYVGSRAVGVEIHMSTVINFEPDASTLATRGNATRFTFGDLTRGQRYYFKARAYDIHGNLSEWSNEVSAVPHGVDREIIDPNLRIPRVVEELPDLPNPDYQPGDIVTLIHPDGSTTLYEAVDTDGDGVADTWRPVLRADAIQGELQASQLADGIITSQKVAQGLQIPHILDDVPFTRANRIKFGIFTFDGVNSIYDTWDGVEQLEQTLNTTFWSVHFFTGFGIGLDDLAEVTERIINNGRIPFISLENSDQTANATFPPEFRRNYTNASIIAGDHDDWMTPVAEYLRDLDTTIYIRIFPEMNGSWAPWYPGDAGPQQVVDAWIHVVNLFRSLGANNVRWVWNPNVTDDNWDYDLGDVNPNWAGYRMEHYYPGDEYVDYTGFDTYNRGTRPLNTPAPAFVWQEAHEILDMAYARVQAIAPERKQIIGEFGTESPSSVDAAAGLTKAGWVQRLFQDVTPEAYPGIEALIYFDENKANPEQAPDNRTGDYDWRMRSDPATIAQWQAGLAIDVVDEEPYPIGTLAYVLSDRQTYEYVEGYWWQPVESSILKAGSVVAGTVAAGAIGAREIAANSIVARHLAIADTENLARNPNFETGLTGWYIETSGYQRVIPVTSPVADQALELDIHPGWPNNVWIEGGGEFEQGATFFLAAWIRRVGANAPLSMMLRYWDEDGLELYPFGTVVEVPSSVPNNQWMRYSRQVEATHDTERIARISLQFSAGTNPAAAGSWQVTGLVWRMAIGGELVVDGTIRGHHIAARSITADRMVLGDTTNMIHNSEFSQEGESGLEPSLYGWEMEASEGVWAASLNTQATRPSPAFAQIGLATYWRNVRGEWLPAMADASYYLSVTARRTGTVASMLFGIEVETATGTIVPLFATLAEDAVQFTNGIPVNTWTTLHGITPAVPANARRIRFVLNVEGHASSTAQWHIAKTEMRRAYAAELIVDGSITADHLQANSVTAGAIRAGSIETDHLTIGAIQAEHIRAGALTAGYNNLLLNGGAERGVRNVAYPPESVLEDPNQYFLGGGSFSSVAGRSGGRAFRYNYAGKTTDAFVYFNGYDPDQENYGTPINAGDALHMHGWFRRSSGTMGNRQVALAFFWRDANGDALGDNYIIPEALGTTWQRVSANVVAPANAKYVLFTAVFLGVAGAVTIDFDDVTARIASSGDDINDLGDGTRVDSSGVSVYDMDNELQFKIGDITGLPQVAPPPPGQTRRFGGWGTLNTGIFIVGAPRILYANRVTGTRSFWLENAPPNYPPQFPDDPTARQVVVNHDLVGLIPDANLDPNKSHLIQISNIEIDAPQETSNVSQNSYIIEGIISPGVTGLYNVGQTQHAGDVAPPGATNLGVRITALGRLAWNDVYRSRTFEVEYGFLVVIIEIPQL